MRTRTQIQLARLGRGRSVAAWAVLVAAALAHGADLKGLVDPTRAPPGAMHNASTGGAGGHGATANSAEPAASTASVPAPVVTPLRLQALRLDPASGRGVALIDAHLVELGGRLPGGWTVKAMDSQGVELHGPSGDLHLELLGTSRAEHQPVAKHRPARKEAL